MSRTRAATIGLALPATMALAMSTDTSYRFLGQLGITDRYERGLLCGTAEAAIAALSVYSWATRKRPAAWLAYAIVLVQAVPAFSVTATTGGGIFRAAIGPVLLALLLHLLLGLEVKMSGAKSNGLTAQAFREVRERLIAYLGIGRRGTDSAAIARSRAADRAVFLADRVAGARQGSRSHRRLTAHLAAAIDHARHGLDDTEAATAEASIVSRIIRRKSAADLATIAVRHDWTAGLPTQKTDDTLIVNHTETSDAPTGEQPLPMSEAAYTDITVNSAALLAHEPPPWSSLSLREAVAKADEILPGRTASMLSLTLREVGIEATAASIRSTRSVLRRASHAADGTA